MASSAGEKKGGLFATKPIDVLDAETEEYFAYGRSHSRLRKGEIVAPDSELPGSA
jgi:hypothetical protein